MIVVIVVFFFFFQAEDGIRDTSVTGVQTCALPIYDRIAPVDLARAGAGREQHLLGSEAHGGAFVRALVAGLRAARSEERRVGKECRAGGWPTAEQKAVELCSRVGR